MPRIARIAFSLTGLLLLYMVNPGLAWLMIGGGLLYQRACAYTRGPAQATAITQRFSVLNPVRVYRTAAQFYLIDLSCASFIER